MVEGATDFACIRVDDTPVTDAGIPNSFVAMYLDETANKLHFRVRYSDATLKLGELLLA